MRNEKVGGALSAFFICILCLFSILLPAQNKKIYKINPGQKITAVILKDDIYEYPQFINGTVVFKNGNHGSARLNYNSLFGEIQFIDSNGDTISLADEKTIDFILIEKDTFYYHQGYLKLIDNYSAFKLAKKRIIAFTNRQKIGGFGEVSSASIETYNTLSNSQYIRDLVAQEILTFSENTIYYFGDRFNYFVAANKKNLLQMKNKYKKQIETYLAENSVDFMNEEHLRRLILFVGSLE